MSKRNKSTEVQATNEELKEILATDAKPAKKQSKHVFARILAFLMAVAPIVLFCLFGISVVYLGETASYIVNGDKSLLDVFLALFGVKGSVAELYGAIEGAAAVAPDAKLFGFLPALAGANNTGLISMLALYAIVAIMVITLILGIISLFSGKAAPALLRVITGANFLAYLGYQGWLLFVFSRVGQAPVYDLFVLGVAAASFIVYFVASAVRAKKHIFLGTLIFLFSTLITAAVGLIYVGFANVVVNKVLNGDMVAFIGSLAIIGVTIINLLVAVHSLSVKKVYGADIIRTVLMLLVGGFFIFAALMNENYFGCIYLAAFVVACAILQLVVQILAVCANKKKAKKQQAAEEAPVVEAVEEAPVEEETVVVYDEDDGATLAVEEEEEPVVEETVEEAPVEEVEEEPAPAPAATADYDYYNSKSFDPFIATLTTEERASFTELFILKYKGELKNIPDYEVGGDNKNFFKQIFINLGAIRPFLPDDLLDKIYQFHVRN